MILSHRRAGRVTTTRYADRAVICIPKSQEPQYAQHHPKEVLVTHPDSVVALWAKRQWVYEQSGGAPAGARLAGCRAVQRAVLAARGHAPVRPVLFSGDASEGRPPRVGCPVAPTRPSCLECVEKHLGAARVLLAKYRDGYPHRLRAIGHLHEAEDESQQWPDLHAAIRAARRAFQRAGAMPDFTRLAMLVLGPA